MDISDKPVHLWPLSVVDICPGGIHVEIQILIDSNIHLDMEYKMTCRKQQQLNCMFQLDKLDNIHFCNIRQEDKSQRRVHSCINARGDMARISGHQLLIPDQLDTAVGLLYPE